MLFVPTPRNLHNINSNMDSSMKRPAKTTPRGPDAKKLKPSDKKDVSPVKKESFSVKSARGNRLVLPKKRARPQEKKEVISEATLQEVKEGRLGEEKKCMYTCGESGLALGINHRKYRL